MFSIHRNHLSDQGVDYVTFGRGDKVLVIITGLSLQGLSDMSDLAIYSLFYRYAKEYKVYIFDRKDHIQKKVFQLRIWLMTSTILYKNYILLMPLS